MNKRLIAVILTLSLVAAGLFMLNRRHRPQDPATIRVSGTVEVTSVEASFRIPGNVKARLVDEGEMVTAGQVIARLADDDLLHEVALRRAEVAGAKAALAELEAGSRREEIARAEAALAAVEAETERQAADYARQETLFRKEVIPRRELEAAKSGRDSSRAKAREAREVLAQVRSGPRRETIDQARARLLGAEEALALARTRLDYATLRSPLAGMVLAKQVEAGEQVAAGSPVVTIGDVTATWIRAYIGETDLGRVKTGQKVRIRTDDRSGKVHEGTVTFIAQEAEFTPKNVQTEKERVKLVYRIKITVPNPARELKPGMPVDADIITGP
jgi:HlyD family secretion protein